MTETLSGPNNNPEYNSGKEVSLDIAEEGATKKLPVPQPYNGVSQDFLNTFAALYSILELSGVETALAVYAESPIQNYDERFKPEIYDRSHETEETKELIAILDEQVTNLRKLFDDKTITKDEFDKIYKVIKTVLPR